MSTLAKLRKYMGNRKALLPGAIVLSGLSAVAGKALFTTLLIPTCLESCHMDMFTVRSFCSSSDCAWGEDVFKKEVWDSVGGISLQSQMIHPMN